MTRLAPPWFKFATFCFDSRQGEDGHAHSLKTVLKPTPVYPRAAMPLRSVSRSCIAVDNCLLPEMTCAICFTNACELASRAVNRRRRMRPRLFFQLPQETHPYRLDEGDNSRRSLPNLFWSEESLSLPRMLPGSSHYLQTE